MVNLRFECSTSHPSGIAKIGDTVYVALGVCRNDSSDVGLKVEYTLQKNWQYPLKKGTVEIGVGTNIVSFTVDEPGCYRCLFVYESPDGQIYRIGAGVIAEPEKFKLTYPKAVDYDDFWAEMLAKLAAVDPEIKTDFKKINNNLQHSYVSADGAFNDKLAGEIYMPANAAFSSCPAVIEFHGAGVRAVGMSGGVMRALDGFINLEVLAHDVPPCGTPEEYGKIAQTFFADYQHRGLDAEKAEDCYFIQMFLRAKRAVEIIKSMPQWDGKNIIVTGGSQGSWQSCAAAALDDAVSGVAVWICAGCNIVPGQWPLTGAIEMENSRFEAYKRMISYIDCAYFMEKIKAPMRLLIGFADPICNAYGILAACGNSPNKDKKIITYPQLMHEDNHFVLNEINDEIKKLVR